MIRSIIAATLCLSSLVSALVRPGTCQPVHLQENFEVSRYTGVWFQMAKDISSPSENGNCAQTRYTPN